MAAAAAAAAAAAVAVAVAVAKLNRIAHREPDRDPAGGHFSPLWFISESIFVYLPLYLSGTRPAGTSRRTRTAT